LAPDYEIGEEQEMTEPTDRDSELRDESFLAFNPQAHKHAVLIAIATAREEGRQEERERWQAWIASHGLAQYPDWL
jgi:hypothetical protein